MNTSSQNNFTVFGDKIKKYWQDAEKRYPLLRYPRKIAHHYLGTTKGFRSKYWIFWLIVTGAFVVSAISLNKGAYLAAVASALYTYYLYRGGHFVIKPTWWFSLLLVALPIFMVYQKFNSNSQQTNTNTSSLRSVDENDTKQSSSSNNSSVNTVSQSNLSTADKIAEAAVKTYGCTSWQKDSSQLPDPSLNASYVSFYRCYYTKDANTKLSAIMVFDTELKRQQFADANAEVQPDSESENLPIESNLYPLLIRMK